MATQERFFPKVENLGRPCKFWSSERGCQYPKAEMEGRQSCGGYVDDYCLFLRTKKGRPPGPVRGLLFDIAARGGNIDFPPGNSRP